MIFDKIWMQLTFNILHSCMLYTVIAYSFFLIYSVSKFFNLAHAITLTFGAYFFYLFSKQIGLWLWFAIVLSIMLSIILVVFIELFIYRTLRNKATSNWKMLVVSLGMYIILQNSVSLIWGDGKKSISTWPVKVGHNIFGAYITDVQIITIVVSVILFTSTILFLQYTSLGKQIRAVSSNSELSNIFGISSDRVILWSFIIGSALAAIAGILIALDTDMTPTMGFHIFLYAVVAMIIGGVGSYKGLIGGALLLATAQHLSAYYIDSKWMDATAYVILILFLIWKPLGFSGKLLKKVEI